ncbi:MAG TPA: hypothetical protein VI408_03240 [Gaiellaceae bacterium]
MAGSDVYFLSRGQRAWVTGGRGMEPESSNPSYQVTCSRCRRVPRDDDDYVGWEAIDDEAVCPGCLTMLEIEALQRP